MEENSHDGGELFDTPENEELADTASTNDDELFESSEVEESKEKSVSEDVKRKSVEAFQKKIDAGEITIDDLPPAQKWMKAELRPKNEVDLEKLADEAIERKLNERAENDLFEQRRSQLRDLELSAKKRAAITDEYNDFRSLGLSKAKALEKAMKTVGVETKSGGTFPPVGGYSPRPAREEDLSAEDRIKKLESARKQQMGGGMS
ncbi:hypothetical protein KBA63_00085 [Candidatus Woesebacteria bacterium]|nr:hypothetical protein [Candidatus Woesebacteria bacterium]